MFLWLSVSMFLVISRKLPNPVKAEATFDNGDPPRMTTMSENVFATGDHWTLPKKMTIQGTKTLPAITRPTWKHENWKPFFLPQQNLNFASEISFEESDQSRTIEEEENSFETTDESMAPEYHAMATRDQPVMPRGFWNFRKKKAAQQKAANLEKDLLTQYDQALLSTDLVKLDTETLKKVCVISSRSQQYYGSRSPTFQKRRLKFFTSKRKKMTANLLYCPNMGAYVRESATNPNQCVYVFKRPLFRTALFLRDQRCVNLNTEVTAPKPE